MRMSFFLSLVSLALSAGAMDLAVPVFDTSLGTPEKRAAYLAEFRRAGVKRALVVTNCGRQRSEFWPPQTATLREIVGDFESNGVDVVVWIGETVGHGGMVEAEKRDADRRAPMPYTHLIALDGREQDCRFCPFDAAFRASVTNYVAEVARCGAKTLLLDDDFRLNETTPEPACACPLHLARIRELCGERDLTREELFRTAFTGKDNPRRRAFIRANGESLRLFAREIRAAADSVDPKIRVGLASPHSTFGVDGVTSGELARILAGPGNRPILRLHGAPYWANWGWMKLPSIFELARLFAVLARADCPEAELMTEGDVYPRPRYHTPASALELFDAAMRADGRHDIAFKYIIDYHSSFDYERGYVERHIHDLPALERIERFFPQGANEGVRVHASVKRFVETDFSLSPRTADGVLPYAAFACAYAGVPVVYEGDAPVHAAFGEDVRDLLDSNRPLIVDAVAAILLTEAGVDCGLEARGDWLAGDVNYLKTENELALAFNGSCRLLKDTLKPEAQVVLRAEGKFGEKKLPLTADLAYTYRNAAGRRFLVYLYDAMSLSRVSGLHRGYLAQHVLVDGYRFLAGKNPPVFALDHPDLYLETARGEDGSLALLVANCSADPILRPVFTLDRDYSAVESATEDRARLEERRLVLDRPIPAFDFRAFRLK